MSEISSVFINLSPSDLQNLIADGVAQAFKKFGNLQPSKEKEDDMLNPHDAAKYIGVVVGSLYNLTSKKKIPYIKSPVGKKLYFSKKALNEWLSGGTTLVQENLEVQVDKQLTQASKNLKEKLKAAK